MVTRPDRRDATPEPPKTGSELRRHLTPTLKQMPHRQVTCGRAVNTYRTRAGDDAPIELAYDVFGEQGLPLVAIMGIGAQRIFWDEQMCYAFVEAGFQVVRFDARDVGESTHLDADTPKPAGLLARRMANLAVAAPYTLSDMARDVDRPVRRARLAIRRTSSACRSAGWSRSTWRSSTPRGSAASRRSCRARVRAGTCRSPARCERCSRRGRRPRTNRARCSSSCFARSAARCGRSRRRACAASAARPSNAARTRAASCASSPPCSASGDRRPELAHTPVPTLVIHGSRDPMFPLAAGRALARIVPRGTWLPIQGMAHYMPAPVWPVIVRAIARHAKTAERAGRDSA